MTTPADSDSEFDVDRLQQMTNSMITAITHPKFVDAMRQIKASPTEDRLSLGAKLLDPNALRAAGVPLPTDMRITSRYFEPGHPGLIEVGDQSPPTDTLNPKTNYGPPKIPKPPKDIVPGFKGPSVNGPGGCACGGGLSFCGGAGGNS